MRTARPFLALALALGIAPALVAQSATDGPYWSTTPLPANFVSMQALGSMVFMKTTTEVHCYSGLTRQWTIVPVSPTATTTLTNTFGLIRDGTSLHAYSTLDGSVATITVPTTASLQVGTASNSWVALVVDGTTAYAYSGFFTQWATLTTTSSFGTARLGAHVVLLPDATDAYAFSAFHGTWVATALPVGATTSAYWFGAVLMSSAPDTITAFSAYRNTWASTPFPVSGLTTFHGDGYATFISGANVLGFSSLTGRFASYQCTAVPTITNGPSIAVLTDAGTPIGYAPGVDQFVPLLTPVPGGVRMASNVLGSYAIVDDGTVLQSFNAITGSLQYAPSSPSYTYRIGDNAAVVCDLATGIGYAYSVLKDQWVALPSPQPTISMTATLNGVLVRRATDWLGFSARTGTFATEANTTATLVSNGVNALAALRDGDRVIAFDSKSCKFVTQMMAATPNVSIFRHSGVVHDGTTAYGFSLLHGCWESLPIGGAVSTYRSDAAIGYVTTPTDLHLFTGSGSLNVISRMPEFIRSATRGADFHIFQNGAPGSFVFRVYAGERTEQAIAPYGTLLVEPASTIAVTTAVIPASGFLRTVFAIPDNLQWNLVGFHIQDLVLPPTGSAFLTNVSSPIFY